MNKVSYDDVVHFATRGIEPLCDEATMPVMTPERTNDRVTCSDCMNIAGVDYGAWNRTQGLDFIETYIRTLLWSELDDDGEPLEGHYDRSDVHQDAYNAMAETCEDFMRSNLADLAPLNPGQCGHDFALTRNRHGAGFWDRGLGDVGDRLTANSHPYGETNMYVGDDGKLHVT